MNRVPEFGWIIRVGGKFLGWFRERDEAKRVSGYFLTSRVAPFREVNPMATKEQAAVDSQNVLIERELRQTGTLIKRFQAKKGAKVLPAHIDSLLQLYASLGNVITEYYSQFPITVQEAE